MPHGKMNEFIINLHKGIPVFKILTNIHLIKRTLYELIMYCIYTTLLQFALQII